MKVIDIAAPGGPEQLVLGERPLPEPGPGQLRIRVRAAGVNRPDILQRQGHYDPPEGASDVPGLEVAGEVDALGAGAAGYAVGDRVMALLGGGGYAEACVVDTTHCLPIPEGVSLVEAAALPETWVTVWANVFEHGALAEGETLLVHGGSSGIGHTAIQLAKARGAKVITTSGTPDKVRFCEGLGADLSLDYKAQDFVDAIKRFTDRAGVDVVLDMVGGAYLRKDLEVLAFRGRHVSIAFLGGAVGEVVIPKLMAKQATLTGSTLRARPAAEKARLIDRVRSELGPLLESGKARPHVDRTFPLAEAAEAHRCMESGDFLGKLVLEVG